MLCVLLEVGGCVFKVIGNFGLDCIYVDQVRIIFYQLEGVDFRINEWLVFFLGFCLFCVDWFFVGLYEKLDSLIILFIFSML